MADAAEYTACGNDAPSRSVRWPLTRAENLYPSLPLPRWAALSLPPTRPPTRPPWPPQGLRRRPPARRGACPLGQCPAHLLLDGREASVGALVMIPRSNHGPPEEICTLKAPSPQSTARIHTILRGAFKGCCGACGKWPSGGIHHAALYAFVAQRMVLHMMVVRMLDITRVHGHGRRERNRDKSSAHGIVHGGYNRIRKR